MNRRERLMLMAAIVMLGAVVFKFLIYDPQRVEYATLVQTRDAAAAELAAQKRILDRSAQVHQEYDRMVGFIRSVEAKLPRDAEIPALLTTMEAFTQRLGIGLMGIRPGPLQPVTPAATGSAGAGGAAAGSTGAGGAAGSAGATGTAHGGVQQGGAQSAGGRPAPAGKTPTYSRMQVDLSLTGTFPQIVEYLRELRQFPRLIIVGGVSVSPQTLPRLSVSLQTEIFTLGSSSGGGK